jgi:aryl-alcohol dehydrogenase-like predicted oxidoreductase
LPAYKTNYNNAIQMKYRTLGNTRFTVSEIGFGAWAIGGAMDVFGMPVGWANVTDSESVAAIERAVELGINFFDTADVYGMGHSEELLGKTLKGKDCIIATKVGNRLDNTGARKDFSEKWLRDSIEGSLRRLNREAIDLYQLHNPDPGTYKKGEVFGAMNRLKEEGKIRAIGVSISNPKEGLDLIRNHKPDCLQVLFNILNQEPANELIPEAEKNGVGIIVRVPLASGLLTGKFRETDHFYSDDNRSNYLIPQRMKEALNKLEKLKELTAEFKMPLGVFSLAFLLNFAGVSCLIPGAKNPKQVEQNASASGIEIRDDIVQSIREEFSGYNFYLRYNVRV